MSSYDHSPGAPAPGDRSAPPAAQERAADGAARSPGSAPDKASALAEEQSVSTEQATGAGEAPDAAADVVEADLAALIQERDDYLALAQRTQADFENFRKRKAREAEVAEARGTAKLAKELLPAIDNLQRALDAADQEDPLLGGVKLVYEDIVNAFARLGIERFSPRGEPFDPAEHEAMAQQPIEGAASGTVVEVYQPGYRYNGTVIRPARVVVAA